VTDQPTINNHNDSPTPDQPNQPKRGKRWLKVLILTFVVIPTIALAVVFYLLRSQPVYWEQHQQFLARTTPDQMQSLSENVLDKLNNLAITNHQDPKQPHTDINSLVDSTQTQRTDQNVKPSDIKIDDTHQLFLNHDELAATFTTQFDQWIQWQGYNKPEEISDPMIALKEGGLYMAFELQLPGFSQVLSAKFDLQISNAGFADLTLDHFLAGRLPIPANGITQYITDQAPTHGDRAAKLGHWLSKLEHFQFKPVIKIEHRRRATVLAYNIAQDGINLTLRIQDHQTYRESKSALASVPVN